MGVVNPHSPWGEDASSVLVGVPPDRSPCELVPLLAETGIRRTNVVSVLYDATAESFLEELETHAGDAPADVELVSVGTASRSAAASANAAAGSFAPVRAVPDRDDRAGVLSAVRDALDGWSDEPTLLYLDSLDALFDASDDGPADADGFLADLVALLERSGTRGVVGAALGGWALSASRHHFDVAIELEPNHGRDDAAVIDADELFDALGDGVRRVVLEYLLRADRPVESRTLAQRVVERTDSDPPLDLEHAYVGLHHVHLPRLVESGLVDVDDARGTVEARDAAASVRPYLALANATHSP